MASIAYVLFYLVSILILFCVSGSIAK